jgi:hypothetical protein
MVGLDGQHLGAFLTVIDKLEAVTFVEMVNGAADFFRKRAVALTRRTTNRENDCRSFVRSHRATGDFYFGNT